MYSLILTCQRKKKKKLVWYLYIETYKMIVVIHCNMKIKVISSYRWCLGLLRLIKEHVISQTTKTGKLAREGGSLMWVSCVCRLNLNSRPNFSLFVVQYMWTLPTVELASVEVRTLWCLIHFPSVSCNVPCHSLSTTSSYWIPQRYTKISMWLGSVTFILQLSLRATLTIFFFDSTVQFFQQRRFRIVGFMISQGSARHGFFFFVKSVYHDTSFSTRACASEHLCLFFITHGSQKVMKKLSSEMRALVMNCR